MVVLVGQPMGWAIAYYKQFHPVLGHHPNDGHDLHLLFHPWKKQIGRIKRECQDRARANLWYTLGSLKKAQLPDILLLPNDVLRHTGHRREHLASLSDEFTDQFLQRLHIPVKIPHDSGQTDFAIHQYAFHAREALSPARRFVLPGHLSFIVYAVCYYWMHATWLAGARIVAGPQSFCSVHGFVGPDIQFQILCNLLYPVSDHRQTGHSNAADTHGSAVQVELIRAQVLHF